jgi:predicted nucleic acid-binding protein
MSYLLDTNILLRLAQKSHPMHTDVRRALVTIRRQDSILLCITPQNLIEFWAVATRSLASNGLGLTTDEASREIKKLKRIFVLCPDRPEIFDVWENLVVNYQVSGKPTHDTRLVAAAIVHRLTHLLTFNTDDFKRFSEIVAVDPRSISSEP